MKYCYKYDIKDLLKRARAAHLDPYIRICLVVQCTSTSEGNYDRRIQDSDVGVLNQNCCTMQNAHLSECNRQTNLTHLSDGLANIVLYAPK